MHAPSNQPWLILFSLGTFTHRITIEYLADRREFIPMLAGWHHAEWGYLRPGQTVEDRAVRVRRECAYCQVRTTWLRDQSFRLGSPVYSLRRSTGDAALERPWLSESFRRRGH